MSAALPSLVAMQNVVAPASEPLDERDGRLSDEEKNDYRADTSVPSASSIELQKSYESKHRWDPAATWTQEEETKLRRKLDIRVCAVACLCFAALQLDRGNISNALSDNMLVDLHMTTANYNTGMTIFYLCFLCAELPSQMISKKLGSDVWIPIQMMSWSAVAIGQVGLTGKSSFYATRALLGLIEGGFIADTILYLSYYCTAAELTIRLSWFWVTLTSTTIVGSLLATAIFQLDGVHGLEGWRWLFALEGTITFLIGFWAFFYLPASPTQTAGRFRGKGWFTEREEIIVVNKVLRDDPTKSSMHNRQGLSFGNLLRSLSDFDLWPLYLLGLTTFIAPSTVAAYFTLSLKNLGYSTFQTNVLTIPSSVLFIILNLSLAFASKRFRERVLLSSLSSWWVLVFLIVLITIPDSTHKWVKWALLSLITAYPYPHPILVSMNSMNSGSVRTRTVASSVYNMAVQSASLIASNIYQPSDAPYYHKGNRVLVGIVVANLVLYGLTKLWYIWRNHARAKIWDSWTLEQRDEYIRTTKDQGNKRLDFRFLH
ncbi:hypothetical protein EHS25_001707 [Saitozyma podzolica]|uniref:Major facilitator superfamily (MFS) profile domain-containing protein n=1 Tax=Saitozyma podzolica TaxID=1890683 RepID=A0A427YF45_9TREE|nr:hypothetical protein EHS25_001707 [Saitozyma podzolica]